MAYVTVPKDLSAVKTKVMFNLTKRQLFFFSIGTIVGIATYYATRGFLSTNNAVTLMMITVFPSFLLAMYTKNGQTLEVVLKQIYLVKFGTAKTRPYKSQNFYAQLEKQYDLNKEVNYIVRNTLQEPSKAKNPVRKASKKP